MIRTFGIIRQVSILTKGIPIRMSRSGFGRGFSTDSDELQLKEFLDYLESLKNYEKLGVPKGAGTDSDGGFDLGRMKRLLERLGNPLSKYKVVHIAGTKGKGSTAAFISNILRAEGYSVGCYTSPHLLTIRERFSFGKNGEPVSAGALNNLFHRVRTILDQSIVLENGSLTHFEDGALAGYLNKSENFLVYAFKGYFEAQEKVDIAVVEAGLGGARDATNVICSEGLAMSVITTIGAEHLSALGGSLESIAIAKSGIIKRWRPLVMGGPFEPHIERIIRQKAASMFSPVVSASDPGVHSIIKGFYRKNDKPYQLVDLLIQVEKDFQLFIELYNVRLHMLGLHQLQNAVTATCASLCLRNLGWEISDESIRNGLENTNVLGRCQFLTQEEAEVVGLSGIPVLIDGAHTEAAAKGLADTIKMTYPNEPLALVVTMASDKDHLSFARQLLSGSQPEVVVLTEVSIAGGKSRMTPASLLKNIWIQAACELGNEVLDTKLVGQADASKKRSILITDNETEQILDSVKLAFRLLRLRTGEQSGLVVITGSLHIASSVLASLDKTETLRGGIC